MDREEKFILIDKEGIDLNCGSLGCTILLLVIAFILGLAFVSQFHEVIMTLIEKI